MGTMRPGEKRRLPNYHGQQLPPDDAEAESELHERPPNRPRVERIQEGEETVNAEADRVNAGLIHKDDDEEFEQILPFRRCSAKRENETSMDASNGDLLSCNVNHIPNRCCHNEREDLKASGILPNGANPLEPGYIDGDNLVMRAEMLLSNAAYANNVREFLNRAKCKRKEGLVVLDLFGGVGTALVVLKRLNIPIKKVIHVELDKVATFVSRMNHDYAFVESLRKFASEKLAEGEDGGYAQLADWKKTDDGIEHIYYDRFEDIFDHLNDGILQAFVKTHNVQDEGVDLMIGGPPCVDFTGVNAEGQGTKGKNGKYMMLTAQLFKRIEDIQKHRKVYVVIENVFISNAKGRAEILQAFGFKWDPIELDACQISPIRRRRLFFTNIPYSDRTEGYRYCNVTPESCLDNGYTLKQLLIPCNKKGDWRWMKAHTFMASKRRLQGERMHVFKRDENGQGRYVSRVYNVAERERIMGYPEGYVSQPVSLLFKILWFHGYARCRKYESDIAGQLAAPVPLAKGWREMLPPELHIFAGNFSGQLFQDIAPFNSQAEIYPKVELSPPTGGKTLDYYDQKEYAMRLIGNAFSVPVVEQVAFRLKELFEPAEERRCKELYSNWQYQYKWDAQQSNEAVTTKTTKFKKVE